MNLFDLFYNINELWGYGKPNVKVIYKDDDIVLEVEVPGIAKEKLDVKMSGDILTVKGEDGKRKIDLNLKVLNDIDKNKITAKQTNGILYIILPKLEESKPKIISID